MYYLLILSRAAGLDSSYTYYVETDETTGNRNIKSFATLDEAKDFIMDNFVANGRYSLSQFKVVKGVVITPSLTLTEETV